jgi:hypothetical protein
MYNHYKSAEIYSLQVYFGYCVPLAFPHSMLIVIDGTRRAAAHDRCMSKDLEPTKNSTDPDWLPRDEMI